MNIGKYVESGYEFIYTVKIPSDVMANGTITEERRVFIPDVDFKSAYEIAETIMGNTEGFLARMVSLSPKTRGKKGDE